MYKSDSFTVESTKKQKQKNETTTRIMEMKTQNTVEHCNEFKLDDISFFIFTFFFYFCSFFICLWRFKVSFLSFSTEYQIAKRDCKWFCNDDEFNLTWKIEIETQSIKLEQKKKISIIKTCSINVSVQRK